ncbi:hypothetical protein RFI_15626, partial [Reticulomyxa filosa]
DFAIQALATYYNDIYLAITNHARIDVEYIFVGGNASNPVVYQISGASNYGSLTSAQKGSLVNSQGLLCNGALKAINWLNKTTSLRGVPASNSIVLFNFNALGDSPVCKGASTSFQGSFFCNTNYIIIYAHICKYMCMQCICTFFLQVHKLISKGIHTYAINYFEKNSLNDMETSLGNFDQCAGVVTVASGATFDSISAADKLKGLTQVVTSSSDFLGVCLVVFYLFTLVLFFLTRLQKKKETLIREKHITKCIQTTEFRVLK